MRIKLTLTFDGSAFHGWQAQKNALSVQKTVSDALSSLFKTECGVTGCSRTDSGVHARRFVCHTDISRPFPVERIPAALNSMLPASVAALSAERVPDSFHARYSVKIKTYRYYILDRDQRSPLLEGRVCHWRRPLDENIFFDSCSLFEGKKDFASFMAAGSDITDTVRTVYSCRGFRDNGLLVLEIAADGFLYNMVRIIAGTLMEAASGRELDVADAIASRDRSKAGFTAPPQGLYLWSVEY